MFSEHLNTHFRWQWASSGLGVPHVRLDELEEQRDLTLPILRYLLHEAKEQRNFVLVEDLVKC